MLKKDYSLYAFDLDGTLVDTRVDIALTLRAILLDAGMQDVDKPTLLAAIGGGARNAVNKLTGLEGERLDYYEQMFYDKYNEMCADNTSIYDGGEELVRDLKQKGKILAVITMKARIPTIKILESHGLLKLIDDVLAFDDVEKRKPDPSSFFKLMKKHSVTADETLMIGDTTTDLKYAKNAGVDVVAAKYGYGITQDLLNLEPEYEIDSLKEIYCL